MPIRGGRGRGGLEGGRGGRGRGSDRGRGGGRGGRGGTTTNGTRAVSGEKSKAGDGWDSAGVPSTEAVGGWDSTPAQPDTSAGNEGLEPAKTDAATGVLNATADGDGAEAEPAWASATAESSQPVTATAEPPKSSLIPQGAKKSWASLLGPKAVPAPAVIPTAPAPKVEEKVVEATPPVVQEQPTEAGLIPPEQESRSEQEPAAATPEQAAEESAAELTPSKDELTEVNLEQIYDDSVPPATATAASTVASTQDPHSNLGTATPLTAAQQPATRPGMSGFATSALKATNTPGRSTSFQRRIMEQQEAVVMPGKHAVDRAAVQFGSMGLNGSSEDLDVDETREEAETRAQPPQHSPIAPRASLPPAPQQMMMQAQDSLNEPTAPTPRQAPGLPPVPQQQQQAASPPQAPQAMHQQAPGMPYNQFGRYPQPEQASASHKAYDPFGQSHQTPLEGYTGQTQAPSQQQTQPQSQFGGLSSAPTDYSSFYQTAEQRNPYSNNYFGGAYGHQGQQSQQDIGAAQQRAGSGFGTSAGDMQSQFATAQPPQSRYGLTSEAQQNSGHNTPAPTAPGQQQQPQHSQQQPVPHQSQGQPGGHSAYPYAQNPYYNQNYYGYMNQQMGGQYGRNRPMFDDVRRYDDGYQHQYSGYGNQGYGAPYGGAKGGMYGHPQHGYGVNPQASYEHSSSPANAGSFGQHSMPSRESALTSGMSGSGYGARAGSAQPSDNQQQHSTAANPFGSMPDMFARSQSGYGQNQPLGQQHSGQQPDDVTKYGETKASPTLGQPGRPGSTNQSVQGGLPIPQSQQGQQQGYGSYPGHQLNQMGGQQQQGQQQQGQQQGGGNQYGGGLGGLSGHGQSHQASGYGGNYGGGFGSYYGNNARGGWSGNYGQH